MNDVPQQDWSMDRLAKFCLKVGRRHAADAWKVGKACLIARSKVAHGEWLGWVDGVFGRPALRTIERYMAVAERYEADEVEDKTLGELYSASAKAGGKTPSSKKSPDPKQESHAPVFEPGPPTPEKLATAVSHHAEELVLVCRDLAAFPEKQRRAAWRKVGLPALRAAVKSLNEQIAWLEGQIKSAA